MTAHVMDMGNKKKWRIFIILPTIFLFLFCKKTNSSTSLFEKEQDSIVANINVKFLHPGSFSLNTLINQRSESYTLYSKKKYEEQTLPITISKPTVFTSYRLENKKTVVRQYISFGNDTLNFEFNKETSAFKGLQKNNILNRLFPENEDFHFLNKETDLNKYMTSINEQHLFRIKKLNSYSTNYNETQLTVLRDYLNLYNYYKIFNIDFSTINSPSINEKLRLSYNKLIKNIDLLDKINTILTKQIMYNVLRYTAYTNNKELYQSIGLLDEKLRDTEVMNGFLYDILLHSANTLSVADENEIKKYIKEKKIIKEKKTIIDVSPYILKQTIKSLESKDIEIQKILSTTTEDFVLVDLWATWCVPCIQENPYWEKAKSKYNGKVKFVKISIDTNKNKWGEFIKKQGQINNNFIIDNPNHPFIKSFKINAIPRFMLFNKHFQIVAEDFTRPSDDNFENELENNFK